MPPSLSIKGCVGQMLGAALIAIMVKFMRSEAVRTITNTVVARSNFCVTIVRLCKRDSSGSLALCYLQGQCLVQKDIKCVISQRIRRYTNISLLYVEQA